MDWILDVDRTWPSGYEPIGVRDGRLVEADKLSGVDRLRFDANETIATPGWINAHSHLELSGCPPIDFNGSFVDWIQDVLEFKLSLDSEELKDHYRDGCEQLIKSGVSHVVDHCDKTEWVLDVLDTVSVSVSLLKELIAFTDEQIQTVTAEAEDYLSELQNRSFQGGLAPHAPYSAHPEIYSFTRDRIESSGWTGSSHLHEVQGEFDFVGSASGPFAELLRQRTGKDPTTPYSGKRALPELVKWGYLNQPIFGIHMNYMTDSDYRWLEASQIRPVFCPRSYKYFGHETLPVEEWIRRNIPFALGTDSMASNEGLDMLAELGVLSDFLSEELLDPDTILKSLTLHPSRVIGEPDRGVMTHGTPADLSVFDVSAGSTEGLIRGDAEPLAVIKEGSLAWVNHDRVVDGEEVLPAV